MCIRDSLDVSTASNTCLGLSVKYLLFLILNQTGMQDFKMKETFVTSDYNMRTLFAVVDRLECERGPGSRTDKFSGRLSYFTAVLMSN